MKIELDTSWHAWKETLNKAINAGQMVGMSDHTINNIAYRVGDFLSNHVDPGNREQRLLKELWDEGNDLEKHALASMMSRAAGKMNSTNKQIQEEDDI